MISEERFFQNVKEQFQGFAPNVPASVYQGMRRKLWMSNFLSFSASRMNVWYLLLLAGATTAAVLVIEQPKISAQKIDAQSRNIELVEASQIAPMTFIASDEVSTPSCCIASKNECAPNKGKAVSGALASTVISKPDTDNIQPNNESAITPELVAPEKISEPESPKTLIADGGNVAEKNIEPNTTAPVKMKPMSAPAPLTDQLKSPKKELRLLVDIIRYTETTSKN